MKKMKPVWRMNTGKGVPEDLGEWVVYEKNQNATPVKSVHLLPYVWHPEAFSRNKRHLRKIYAYETARTKEAKYRMTACECVLQLSKCGISENMICLKCKGKGMVREQIK